MMKATLPEVGKKTQKGEAHYSGLRDNFHVLSLPASGKRENGGTQGLCQMKSSLDPQTEAQG